MGLREAEVGGPSAVSETTGPMLSLVSRLNQRENVAILLAEQNAHMALRFAQYCYVMENGRIVLGGDAKTISGNEDTHSRRRKRWLS